MKFALYTISFSPHQIPLAKALIGILGVDEYRYVSALPVREERKRMGWGGDVETKWHLREWEDRKESRKVLASADVLMCGLRDLPLMEDRCKKGLTTIYCAERWFKPWTGLLRLLSPAYFKMAWSFVRLLRGSDVMYYFPMGIHAARDMARLCGLFTGDLRCLFRPPKLDFEKKPGGRIQLAHNAPDTQRYCLDKMRMWGYFVEPTNFTKRLTHGIGKRNPREIRVLWVGRFLNLKRVDTIIRAVGELANLKRLDGLLPAITLDLYGSGPAENRLKKLAARYGDAIRFYPPVPIDYVRQLMHEHDVYVLASDAHEGWGAVVSEALEEDMLVIGTKEAGSSATMLPKSMLFHAGDHAALLKLIWDVAQKGVKCAEDGNLMRSARIWETKYAAKVLVGQFIYK